MDRAAHARRLGLYTNPSGESVERVDHVLRLRCPSGCTEIVIAVFVQTHYHAVSCPVCQKYIPVDTGTWGKMGVVFMPDEIGIRERIQYISDRKANDDDDAK